MKDIIQHTHYPKQYVSQLSSTAQSMCLRHPPEVNNSTEGPHETHLIADQYDIQHLKKKKVGRQRATYPLNEKM